jgi:crotonobetainyl-CoA:carnitine CoA-transferase CaiB-like acyl-CoA transferase
MQPKPLPAPNSDFYEVYETLSAEELATVKKVRAFMEAKVAIVTHDKLAAVAKAIGRGDVLTDPRFADPSKLTQNMPQLAEILDQVFAAQPMAHWYQVFSGVHVTFGAVRGPRRLSRIRSCD